MLEFRDWMTQANCAGLDREMFFDDDSEDAIRICNGCSVRRECLAYAFETDETLREGVFGGTTGKERTDYARSRGIRPGRISDRITRPNSGRAWVVQDHVQGDESEDWDELVRLMED